jgi:hypothetical protein
MNYYIAQEKVCRSANIRISASALLDAWGSFVDQVENGYEWDISEYRNDLRVRDSLEVIASSAKLNMYPEHDDFLSSLRTIDNRFKAIAHPVSTFPGQTEWWKQVAPKDPGDELKAYCTEVFGFYKE